MFDRATSRFGGPFARKVAVVASGTIGAQFLVVVSTPLITRLYSPADMGVLALYIAFLTVSLSFASMRYELAIPLPGSETDSLALIVLCFVLLTAVCALNAGLLVLAGESLLQRLNAPELYRYGWILPVGLFASGSYQILNHWAIRERRYSTLARTKFTQGLGQVCAQIGFGALRFGPIGLLVGDVIGRTSGTGRLATILLRRRSAALRGVKSVDVAHVASRFRGFSLASTAENFINTVGVQLPAVLLAMSYGPAVAGLFALSQRAVGMPMRLVGKSIGQVYHGEAAKLVRERSLSFAKLYRKTTRRLLLIGILPIAAAGIVAPRLFAWIFGPEWAASGTFVLLLVPAYVAQFVVFPISQTSAILERQLPKLTIDGVRVAAVTASILVPYRLGWGSIAAIGTYSVCMTMTYGLYFVFYRRIVADADERWRREPVAAEDGVSLQS